jgi:two-component system OmpR family sensor kinase
VSIRARLVLVSALIALVALVGADIATYTALRSFIYGQVDATLETSHKLVEQSLTTPTMGENPGGDGGDAAQPPAQSNQCPELHGRSLNTVGLVPGTAIEVRSAAGKVLLKCTIAELPSEGHRFPVLPARISGFTTTAGEHHELATYFTAPSRTGRDSFRVRASVLASGPLRGGQLVVAVPLTTSAGILSDLLKLELAVTAAALVVVLALGWWLVRATLHPLRDVERTARAISAGQLTERVSGDQARTEVGRVARAFNVMLGRIESAFAARDRTEADLRASEERMRRFVADASHELRTPLAAVSAYAELFDRGAAARPDDLRRAIDGIQREAARMGHLVEDLLLLAHLDEGRALQIEEVDLVALAADAVTTARAVGAPWPATLRAVRPVEVEGDPLRLRQVLDNLLANVRVHTPPGTSVAVTVDEEGDQVRVTVDDDGPGLSDEEASHIFERFFRADPSRSRDHGGAGLGLSIVAAIVRAHGGTVSVARAPAGGASFVVRLPRAHPPADDEDATGPEVAPA